MLCWVFGVKWGARCPVVVVVTTNPGVCIRETPALLDDHYDLQFPNFPNFLSDLFDLSDCHFVGPFCPF